MAHNYDVGTRAWQPDPTEGWVASEVESKTVEGDRVKLVFQLANGEVFGQPYMHLPESCLLMRLKSRTIETTLAALQDDNNASLPPLMNPAILEASDDLTNLSHLNEPAGGKSPAGMHGGVVDFFQCSKRSSCDTRKRRYTHTVGLS